MIEKFIAATATTLVVGSYIPQIIQGYRTKRLDDVSMGFLCVISLGLVLWGCYAVLNHDMTFLTTNIVSLGFVGTLLAMKIVYDK